MAQLMFKCRDYVWVVFLALLGGLMIRMMFNISPNHILYILRTSFIPIRSGAKKMII